ncbi:MAG: hypothetical protein A2096_08320 [Spirochaetes bacterium GWF1_41_5]|nr:MAG: hypothetical protein A2096_08320 [Spirochaetes bacterium GWF1_41_5]HBE02884.1 hypothetical protein [Spirochaetia bacterium]
MKITIKSYIITCLMITALYKNIFAENNDTSLVLETIESFEQDSDNDGLSDRWHFNKQNCRGEWLCNLNTNAFSGKFSQELTVNDESAITIVSGDKSDDAVNDFIPLDSGKKYLLNFHYQLKGKGQVSFEILWFSDNNWTNRINGVKSVIEKNHFGSESKWSL